LSSKDYRHKPLVPRHIIFNFFSKTSASLDFKIFVAQVICLEVSIKGIVS
jgi:hypothetical protein